MMHHHPHHPWPLPSSPTPLLLPFLLSLFLSSFLPPSFSDVHYLQLYKACSTTRQFSCGNRIISFSYPFRHQESPPQCGYPDAALSCNDTDHTLTIDIGNKPYRVKDDNIDSATNLVTVVDRDFVGNPCPRPSETTTLGPAPFEYTDDDVNATFFIDCPANLPSPLVSISCLENIAAGRRSYYWLGNGRLPYGQMNTCEISFVQVPTTRTAFDQSTTYGEDYAEALQEGFTLKWPAEIAVWCSACNGSGGVCGYESSKPTCFCSDGSATDGSCHKRSHIKKIIIIGSVAGPVGFVLVCVALFLYRTSEIYFPHWVYEHLDRDGDLEAYDVTAETEEIARKMIMVGLWCIQTMPPSRPSMSRVVEMLEGRVGGMEMPPKPYLSSPRRPVVVTSSSS
ncbi:hypothetical protein OPV22_019859 [Ensete ventricosum]|uniref:Wall-associated receptor kinase galacturonan-binding domain-containing protein n=1 Tax=Ensete ventricosum TaxID=4639 RepID=A0AAV8QK54_ENSVE|nr:hypothetical protein OPV22_019859 [Ensete ventricosum]